MSIVDRGRETVETAATTRHRDQPFYKFAVLDLVGDKSGAPLETERCVRYVPAIVTFADDFGERDANIVLENLAEVKRISSDTGQEIGNSRAGKGGGRKGGA